MFHLLPDSKTEFLPPISSLYLVTAIKAADTSTTQARIVLSTCGLIQLLYRIELSVMLELDFWKIVSEIEKLSRVGCISLFVWLTISNSFSEPFWNFISSPYIWVLALSLCLEKKKKKWYIILRYNGTNALFPKFISSWMEFRQALCPCFKIGRENLQCNSKKVQQSTQCSYE